MLKSVAGISQKKFLNQSLYWFEIHWEIKTTDLGALLECSWSKTHFKARCEFRFFHLWPLDLCCYIIVHWEALFSPWLPSTRAVPSSQCKVHSVLHTVKFTPRFTVQLFKSSTGRSVLPADNGGSKPMHTPFPNHKIQIQKYKNTKIQIYKNTKYKSPASG